MRLFLGLDLDAAIRDALTPVIDRLRKSGADVRWVAPADLHLTLKFCGELAQFEPLDAAVRSEVGALPALDLEIAGLGSFPGRGGPGVIWAGGRGELAPVASACERAAAKVGVEPERRPWSAHVTLGRVNAALGIAPLVEEVRAGGGLSFGRMRAAAVTLFRSGTGEGGSRYERIARIPLRSSSPLEASI